MYLDEKGEVIPDLSLKGHLASGVPGSVDGMIEAHKKFGTLPWKDLVQPAIDLAKKGFPLTEREASWFNQAKENLEKYNSVKPAFLIRDNWKSGDTIRWDAMAATLELIRDNGRAGFYEGKTAENLVAEMYRGKGLITLEDLKNYQHEVLSASGFSEKGGAGLGLIEMVRKSGNKLSYGFENINEKNSYFYFQTKITDISANIATNEISYNHQIIKTIHKQFVKKPNSFQAMIQDAIGSRFIESFLYVCDGDLLIDHYLETLIIPNLVTYVNHIYANYPIQALLKHRIESESRVSNFKILSIFSTKILFL
jgi:hypothetical protein